MTARIPRPVDATRGARRGQRVGVALLRVLYRAQVTDAHVVPTTGPVILVANHVGFIDGPLGFITCPRPVHFLVKRAYFFGPVGWLLRGVGQIPITQRSADREALTSAREVLRAGGVVGVFPEGTRGSGEVSSAQQGAAFLALGTKAVVVPVALSGTAGRSKGALPRLRSRLSVTFGEPFDLAGVPEVAAVTGRERVAVGTEVLRARLAEHVRDARI
ncbi:1-acyl-sn-glycerol-3-phosphate acyltransferase [Dermacoccus abyssi]|uniref:1-acyl-sn-glycerol-3-phosphate acyltransferase n=1 Tax=Dermacoccus abyssi TaxID=322596 RepID=A0ABX5ZCD3_9MICO|nr:1-acyl-sn-glycerol-3-phosphate acyltransferase [Dermacoccus abyssi]